MIEIHKKVSFARTHILPNKKPCGLFCYELMKCLRADNCYGNAININNLEGYNSQ